MAQKKIMRHASGKKALRQSLVRRDHNFEVRHRLRTLTNNVLKAIASKNIDAAKAQFVVAQSEWARAAHKGIFHDSAAERAISRMASRIAAASKN